MCVKTHPATPRHLCNVSDRQEAHTRFCLFRAPLNYHNTNFKNTLYTTLLSNNLFNSSVSKAKLLQPVPHFLSTSYLGQSWLPCPRIHCSEILQSWGYYSCGCLDSKASHYHGLDFHNAFFWVLTHTNKKKNQVTHLVLNAVSYKVSEIATFVMLYLLQA